MHNFSVFSSWQCKTKMQSNVAGLYTLFSLDFFVLLILNWEGGGFHKQRMLWLFFIQNNVLFSATTKIPKAIPMRLKTCLPFFFHTRTFLPFFMEKKKKICSPLVCLYIMQHRIYSIGTIIRV